MALTNKTHDPQIVVTGRLKQGEKNDIVTFSIPLGWMELVCIVNLPYEGTDKAPVYIKFKIHRRAGRELESFVGSYDESLTNSFEARKQQQSTSPEVEIRQIGGRR